MEVEVNMKITASRRDDMIQKGASWDEVMKTVDGYYEYRVSKEKFHRSIDNPVQIVTE